MALFLFLAISNIPAWAAFFLSTAADMMTRRSSSLAPSRMASRRLTSFDPNKQTCALACQQWTYCWSQMISDVVSTQVLLCMSQASGTFHMLDWYAALIFKCCQSRCLDAGFVFPKRLMNTGTRNGRHGVMRNSSTHCTKDVREVKGLSLSCAPAHISQRHAEEVCQQCSSHLHMQ